MSDTSAIRPFVRDRTVPTQAATLDAFAVATSGPGIALRQLEPLTELLVQTRNTHYRIVVSRDADIVIQGGSFFPDPTRAHVEGSSLGGNLLKVGWIGCRPPDGNRRRRPPHRDDPRAIDRPPGRSRPGPPPLEEEATV
jgi:hypothetical protein